MFPDVASCWVHCVVPGCRFRFKVFGQRERGLPSTFYLKPKGYHPDLDPRLRPSEITKRQRQHLRLHARRAVHGSAEHRFILQAQKRLKSKRFVAQGSTSDELQLSRKARVNQKRRERYREEMRVYHMSEEQRAWEVNGEQMLFVCLFFPT